MIKYYYCHHITVIHVATTLMIRNISAAAGTDFIDIIWSAPKLLPDSYKVNVTCRLVYNGIEYVRVRLVATPLDTIVTINNLLPGSRCVFTLLAVYNPASIDDGITRTIFTLSSSECSMSNKYIMY